MSTLSTPSTSTSKGERALYHVLNNVLRIPSDSALRVVFADQGIDCISDILEFETDEFLQMGITLAHSKRLSKLQSWYRALDSPSVDSWFDLDADGFASFTRPVGVTVPPPAVTSSSSTDINQQTPTTSTRVLPSILPGLKRIVSDFPKLQKDSRWYNFKTRFRCVAQAQQIWHVFDTEAIYVPNPDDEYQMHMWQLEQGYGMQVLAHCFNTAKSLEFTRGVYIETNDAQAAFAAAIDKFETVLDVENERAKRKQTLENLTVNDNYKQPLEDWLNSWSLHLANYEELPTVTVDDTEKRRLLTNAIKTQTELTQSKNSCAALERAMNKPFPWDDFYKLILDQCKTIDSRENRRPKLSNNVHNGHRNKGNKKNHRGNHNKDNHIGSATRTQPEL